MKKVEKAMFKVCLNKRNFQMTEKSLDMTKMVEIDSGKLAMIDFYSFQNWSLKQFFNHYLILTFKWISSKHLISG